MKVVAYTAMLLLLPSALDFHYFDLYEFVSPTLLVVLATLCLINWRGLKKSNGNDNTIETKIVEPEKTDEQELSSMDVEL